jgi:hypothetical protein
MPKYFVIVDADKTIRFFKDEKCTILHREDGPAVENANGYKAYYINNKLHRKGGPAVVYANEDKEYFIRGKFIKEEQFLARNKKDPCDGKIVEIDGKKYKLNPV